jgi:hypothetical protein
MAKLIHAGKGEPVWGGKWKLPWTLIKGRTNGGAESRKLRVVSEPPANYRATKSERTCKKKKERKKEAPVKSPSAATQAGLGLALGSNQQKSVPVEWPAPLPVVELGVRSNLPRQAIRLTHALGRQELIIV